MDKLGVITLGLNPQGAYLAEFRENLKRVSGMDFSVFRYESLDPTEIAESGVDALVLSPGNALVGLDTDERFERDPGIRPLYDFIRKSVENGVPLLGVNAGHEALNCAYGWAIDKIPDNLKEKYQGEQVINLSSINDLLVSGVGEITMQLNNDYAVLPREKQAERPLQDRVTQLVDFMGRPLISKVKSESGAPVYGVQFNIQPGTEQVFKNFFQLASQYLVTK